MTNHEIARNKASNAKTIFECDYAIKDCHDTLNVGQYAYETPYAQKLWAEIDAYRERRQQLQKRR